MSRFYLTAEVRCWCGAVGVARAKVTCLRSWTNRVAAPMVALDSDQCYELPEGWGIHGLDAECPTCVEKRLEEGAQP